MIKDPRFNYGVDVHFFTDPEYPQDRKGVEALPNDELEKFAEQCLLEDDYTGECLACYAWEVFIDRMENGRT